MTKNYLLAFQAEPNIEIPLDKIQESDFLPAVQNAIEICKLRIDKIKNQPASFANTILGIDQCDDEIFRISLIFSNFMNLLDTPEMRDGAPLFFDAISQFQSEIFSDVTLFSKVKQVFDSVDSQDLTAEAVSVVKKIYSDFVQNGALLDSKSQNDLHEIESELQMAQIKFAENLQDSIDSFSLIVQDPLRLKGLPTSLLESLLTDESTWQLTLAPGCYDVVLRMAEDRKLREQLWIAYHSCAREGAYSNKASLLQIANLRRRKSAIFGFNNFAEMVLKDRMLQTQKQAHNFLDSLKARSEPEAAADLEKLGNLARTLHQIEKLMPWDYEFYGQLLRQQNFSEPTSSMKEYFELNQVLQGFFSTAQSLFGLHFIEDKVSSRYHSKVSVFEVLDLNQQSLGKLFLDLYARENKKSGAWTSLFQKRKSAISVRRMTDVIVAFNFDAGDEVGTVLLEPAEAIQIFHEMGHALHELLAQSPYQALSGANVAFDFIEFPSELMENWARHPSAIQSFARHFKTKEKIAERMAQRLYDEYVFQKGFKSYWQVAMSKLDLAWHELSTVDENMDVELFENKLLLEFPLEPHVNNICRSCIFTHLFQDSYAVTYYTYSWSRELAADCFSLFKKEGLYNSSLGERLKNEILSRGGIFSPWILLENFLGKKPDFKN